MRAKLIEGQGVGLGMDAQKQTPLKDSEVPYQGRS
jgi:hypothetical protein